MSVAQNVNLMDVLDKIKQGKIKSFFTARNKIIYPDAIYHLTQRAPGKEKLFLENSDYLYMLSLIKNIQSLFKWSVFCFVLMPNHLHLLLQIKESNLSEGAKKLFEKYAKYFNSKYKRKGPVFCKPYRVSLCLDEGYLLAASLYIHLNPLKVGLVEKVTDYKWGSVQLYTDKTKNPNSFVNYRFILGILSNKLNKAKDIYANLLEQSNSVEYKNVLEIPDFIGKFKISVLRIIKSYYNKGEFAIKYTSLDDEILAFQNKKRSKKPEDLAAKKYLAEQLLANGYKITEIASLLNVSRQSIYKILELS